MRHIRRREPPPLFFIKTVVISSKFSASHRVEIISVFDVYARWRKRYVPAIISVGVRKSDNVPHFMSNNVVWSKLARPFYRSRNLCDAYRLHFPGERKVPF